jgi:uncharacterized membrane protein
MDISRRKAIGMGTVMALTAAGLSGTVTTATAGESEKKDVHCYGVNKCKGHNDCKTANNECKGHGSCKGQGFVSMSATACDHIGGTVKEGG